jgi:hypothetical protein
MVEKGLIFNWASILSANIDLNIQETHAGKHLGFYMFSFLIDVICAYVPIPEMIWKWTPDLPPIHVYFSELWVSKYHEHFYHICDCFMAPLYHLFFGHTLHRLLGEALETLQEIVDWYMEKNIPIFTSLVVIPLHICFLDMFQINYYPKR